MCLFILFQVFLVLSESLEYNLAEAIAENRILVTLDEHFGDWVILPLSKHPGVIRLKINPTTSKNAINLSYHFCASIL